MNLTATEKNALKAVRYLLDAAHVDVTERTLVRLLHHHPEFPGITSVSDALTDLNIPNMTVRLSLYELGSIPLPAMAFLTIEGGIFAPVLSVSDTTIEWFHTGRGLIREDLNSFLPKWGGIMLLLEPDMKSGEPQYKEKRAQEVWTQWRLPLAAANALAAFAVLAFGLYKMTPPATALPTFLLLATKLTGIAICAMLAWYAMDSSNPFLRSVCHLSKKSNCLNVLKSDGAMLFAGVTWTDVGLLYFAGSFIALVTGILSGKSASVFPAVVLMNVLALPYTVYSLWYQWAGVKKWCPLCLTVLLLLWIEFAAGTGLWTENEFTIAPTGIVLLFASLAAVTSVWLLLKLPLTESTRVRSLEKSLQRLKYDPDYVRTLFNKQRYLPPVFPGMKTGRFGNPLASNRLIMVSNPHCEACAMLHSELEKIIENNPDLQCEIILVSNNDDVDRAVVRLLLDQPENEIFKAYSDWFASGSADAEKWINKYPQRITLHAPGQNQPDLHLRWAELANVQSTPFFFLNGVELPRAYAMSEITRLCRVFQTVVGSDQVK